METEYKLTPDEARLLHAVVRHLRRRREMQARPWHQRPGPAWLALSVLAGWGGAALASRLLPGDGWVTLVFAVSMAANAGALVSFVRTVVEGITDKED